MRGPVRNQLDPVSVIMTLTQPVLIFHSSSPNLQFAYKDAVKDSVKSLEEVKADNIHCSSCIYTGSCFVIGGNQVGQG